MDPDKAGQDAKTPPPQPSTPPATEKSPLSQGSGPKVDKETKPTAETPVDSGMRHVLSALDLLRVGSRTSLHLSPAEHAAVTARMRTHPLKNAQVRDLIAGLLSGKEVDAPSHGTIPADVDFGPLG